MSEEEEKYKKTGMIISVSVHLIVALLFFFLLAWQEPDPPLPEYGIELNFGLDNVGSGETQQPQPTEQVTQAEQNVAETQEEVIEEVPEEIPEPEPEVTQDPVVEETVTEPETSSEVTQPVESPVVEKEKKQPVKKQETPVKETPPAPKKQVTEQLGKETPSANQGDDTNKPGDKGKEEGKVDERALYGAKGGANGASLEMSGWQWDFLPKPNDTSNENGKIVFQITIDEEGYIIGVKTLEKTVSPEIEKVYRQAVEELSFSKTGDNIRTAPTSTGKITFIIRSR